jgi:hypothetical protein
MARNVEHFFKWFFFFSYLDFFLWKKLCSVHLLISSLGHWSFRSLVFWAPCMFWLSVPCLMYSWQRFSLILWPASSIWWPFLFLYRSFLILCSLICQSFHYWAIWVLFRKSLPTSINSSVFPALSCPGFKVSGLYIKVLNPLWVYPYTECKASI